MDCATAVSVFIFAFFVITVITGFITGANREEEKRIERERRRSYWAKKRCSYCGARIGKSRSCSSCGWKSALFKSG